MNVPNDMSSVMSYVLKTMVHRDLGYKQMERERLDKQKIQYEQLLHSVLNRNEDTIKKCIYLYSDISNRIKATKMTIKTLKERLVACKNVMSLDYENMAFLFHNSAMHDETMALIEKIEKFMNVSTMVDQYILQKEYISAAKLFKNTFENYDKLLYHVNALSTIRIDLDAKFQKYYEFLIQELFKVLFKYMETSYKLNSLNLSEIESILFDIITSLIMINKLPDVVLLFQNYIYTALEKIIVDVIEDYSTKHQEKLLNTYKKEASSIRIFSTILVTILEKLKTVSNHIKCMFTVISTRELPLTKPKYNTETVNDPQNVKDNNILLYDLNENMKILWLQIHYALEAFLNGYLPVLSPNNRIKTPSNEYIGKDYITQIFSTRHNNNPKFQSNLFRFDNSTISGVINNINNNPFKLLVHNNNGNDEYNMFYSLNNQTHNLNNEEIDDNNNSIRTNKSTKTSWSILKPNYHYIGYVYQTLMGFLENGSAYLEDSLGYVGTLNTYIHDYIDNIYIPNIKDEFCDKLDKLLDDPTLLFTLGPVNYWKMSARESHVSIGVLALFEESLGFMSQLSLIPHHANTYIQIIVSRIDKFLNVYNNFLEKLYNPDIDDIYQLANKILIKTDSIDSNSKQYALVTSFELALTAKFRNSYLGLMEKSYGSHKKFNNPCDNNYIECYNLIIKCLNDRTLKEYNMIQKNIHLKTLINALESLDWLYEVMNALYKYLDDLKKHKNPINSDNLPSIVDINVNLREHIASIITTESLGFLKSGVKSIRKKFRILRLAIHLEIRIRCLFNLIPFFDPHNYYIQTADTTIDPIILHVVTDILDFMDICQNYLHAKNSKFIFSGLSVFLSKLFIDAVGGFHKINQNGIDKMLHNILALKRDLSSCDYMSDSLTIAINYYELLNKTPDEIFNQIRQNGIIFSQREYIWILKLIADNNSSSDQSINSILKHLNTLFNSS